MLRRRQDCSRAVFFGAWLGVLAARSGSAALEMRVATYAELASAVANADISSIVITENIAISADLRPTRDLIITGGCGATNCTLDAGNSNRHFTLIGRNTFTFRNLNFVNVRAHLRAFLS